MRLVVVLAVSVLFGSSALAQAPQTRSPDDIVKRAREAFRTAKNIEERESIKLWCKDSIASLSFKERDRLSVQAIRAMEANNIDEANRLLKRVNSLKELDDNLSTMVCRPD